MIERRNNDAAHCPPDDRFFFSVFPLLLHLLTNRKTMETIQIPNAFSLRHNKTRDVFLR